MENIFKREEAVVNVGDIVDIIEKEMPLDLQEEWDNSGLLIGFEDKEVNSVLTCLEINDKVLAEAKEMGADMIITHHPIIFSGIKSLTNGEYKSKIIMELIASNISVYSCHTPFDKVKGGNNDIIMGMLGLTSVKNLCGQDVVSAAKMIARKEDADIGRIGYLDEALTFKDVIALVAEKLDMSIRQIHAAGDLDKIVSKIGCCTGAGSDLAHLAAGCGCQVFITGDVKYHDAQDLIQADMCIIDAGHYGTERFFGEAMKNLLEKKVDAKVHVKASEVILDPFVVL